MAFSIDEKTGRITTYQGDSFEFAVVDVPKEEGYEIYFAFYDKNRNVIGQEIKVQSNGSDTIPILVSAELTDLLTVKPREDYAEYYYGIKICKPSIGFENTLLRKGQKIGELNEVIVYPKQLEGIKSGLYTSTEPIKAEIEIEPTVVGTSQQYAQQAKQYRDEAKNYADTINLKMNTFESDIEEGIFEINTAVEEAKTDIEEGIAEGKAGLETLIGSLDDTVAQAKTDINTAVEEAKTELQTTVNELLNELNNELNDIIEEL